MDSGTDAAHQQDVTGCTAEDAQHCLGTVALQRGGVLI
jgi:hypothetical protein